MTGLRSIAYALAAALLTQAAYAEETGDPASGRVAFEQVCGICHAVSPDGSGPPMGPNLFGLIGRKAASEPNFAMYSSALGAFETTWDARALDEFLTDPSARVPGTTMPVMVPDAKDRADIIAYLTSLK